jgi:hypothetical protein
MKKLLLSSIIMFAVCGYVTAQNATESKFKKAESKTAPQTVVAPSDAKVSSAATNDAPTTGAKAVKKTDAAQSVNRPVAVQPADATTASAVEVNAEGDVVKPDEAKKKEIEKAQSATTLPAKKNKDN